ncbi:MAG: secondary thiamine-phosphate synthase enzyme YjbQ [Chloroflexota bacterium]|nr:secondary thiamine-phosphate synthase enzyme YjbQ [Chloroflexota bacterium]MDQ5865961.1 secondary thiamine-phosphate synthase enzyme YjbQ [Chloroflexota bacterium]
MMVVTRKISTNTRGDGHTIDITTEVEKAVREADVGSGVVTLFVVGSTAGLTTLEFEPGAVADLGRVFEQLAPRDAEYQHELRWHDDNGHSHVRAALLGPSLSVPFVSGKLVLGTWQQIVLVDFDTRPRKRDVVAQIMGE